MALSISSTRFRGTTDSGAPLVGGLLYTYVSGTTTNKVTYSDALLTTPNTNPIVLDARGEADVYLASGAYTLVLKTSAGVTVDTADNISAPSDVVEMSASQVFTATAGQTLFLLSPVATDVNAVSVYLDGFRLTETTDYDINADGNLVLTTGAQAGQEVLVDIASLLPTTATAAASVTFTAPATGARLRTIDGRLGETLSVLDFTGIQTDGVTSSQTALAAAVLAAYTAGVPLYWPDYVFVSTASIANFHAVKHIGPGRIKRGSTTFTLEALPTTTNTLYVATTGSAGNDGLTASEPMATFQNAFDALLNYGPVLRGIWNVQAAAGTYDFSGGAQTLSVLSENRINIKGPSVGGHPNVPTAILDGVAGTGTYLHGLRITAGVQATFQDLKAINFTAGAGGTRIGFLADVGSDLYALNCHTGACDWAGLFASSSTLRLSGGIYDGAQWGVGCYNSRFTIGYNGSAVSNRPIIRNSTIAGIALQALSMGHIDYVDMTDNPSHILVDGNSRVHIMGCSTTRGAIGVQSDNGGRYLDDNTITNDWKIGTADACTTATFVTNAYSGESLESGSGQTHIRVGYDRTFRTASGITTGTFPTIYTVPADRLRGVGKSLRIIVSGIYTMTAGNTLTMNIGGMALTLAVSAAATSAMFTYEVDMHEVGGGYRAFGKLTHSLSAGRFGTASTGFVNTTAQAITVGYNLTGAGDSLNIYRSDVYIIG